MDGLYHFIFEYGSGNVSADLAFTALAIVVIVQAFFLSVLSRKIAELKSVSETWEKSSQAGKIQRLEDSIFEFRTEVMRTLTSLPASTPPRQQSAPETDDTDNTEKKNACSPQPKEDTSELQPENKTSPSALEDKLTTESRQPETFKSEEQPQNNIKPEAKIGIFQGLSRTRAALLDKIKSVFTGHVKLSEENIEELEAQLVGADLGIGLSEKLLEDLKTDIKSGKQIEQSALIDNLKGKIEKILLNGDAACPAISADKSAARPLVIMMVGVNGAGKTTTSAKLAHSLKRDGFSPLLVAADTFRAAAVEQLRIWGERLDIPVISGPENAKPSTVVFDAMERTKQGGIDVVIIDTAGRLHTKTNLMQELSGVRNAISRHIEGAPQEVLLVVDGSSGQNAITQAREFQAATGLTGVVITKLDGTPKGGSVVAIKSELGIPVRYIGVGEGLEDLKAFNAREFSEALLGN